MRVSALKHDLLSHPALAIALVITYKERKKERESKSGKKRDVMFKMSYENIWLNLSVYMFICHALPLKTECNRMSSFKRSSSRARIAQLRRHTNSWYFLISKTLENPWICKCSILTFLLQRTSSEFFLLSKLNIHFDDKILGRKGHQKIPWRSFTPHQKRSFKDALINEQFAGWLPS